MSSPDSEATLELAPRPSLRALAILFGLHAVVLAALMAALDPGPPMAGAAALVALSWIFTRRHPVFGYGPNALTKLACQVDGTWTVHDRRGARWDGVQLLGSSLVHDHLLVLNFRLPDGATRTRVLLGDELEQDLLRRLRAQLRMRSGG